jgi:hypothetical protein
MKSMTLVLQRVPHISNREDMAEGGIILVGVLAIGHDFKQAFTG